MFDWLKKKKTSKTETGELEEREMPNGVPGSAVPLINNPMVKNLERIDVQIGAVAPAYLGTRYKTVASATGDYRRLSDSIATLLRVRRVGMISAAGEDILSKTEEVNTILGTAAIYNIENRAVLTDGSISDSIKAAEILNFACTEVVLADGCRSTELLDELTESIPVREYFEQKEAVPEKGLSGCAAEVFGNALNDVRTLMIGADGEVRVCGFPIGNALERDLLDILEEYDPYSNPIMAMILQGGPDAVMPLCNPDEAKLSGCDRCRALASRLFAE